MRSIKHSLADHPIPDFRNFGVVLRVLLGVNALAAAAALVQCAGLGEWTGRFFVMAAWVQPLLFLNLLLLAALAPVLLAWPADRAQAAVLGLAATTSAMMLDGWQSVGLDDGGISRQARAALIGALVAGAMLGYFALRARTFSPVTTEAKLLALTARIRPHFLFNSLNAVLSLIRAEPRRAETALESLSCLFRALMRDPRDLVPLSDEIALCRQYLDLEKLRLGERLAIDWTIDDVPDSLKVPPLILQPLLENAVYHGIEPLAAGGTIRFCLARQGNHLHIELVNPYSGEGRSAGGNRMALNNIRERLNLSYDLEARFETVEENAPSGGQQFRVSIVLPCSFGAREARDERFCPDCR